MQEKRAVKALSFGEILWDIIEGRAHIGGAPCNLAAHIAALGGKATMVSAVGRDELGEKAIRKAEEMGIDVSLISVDPGLPTGKVLVSLDPQGKPEYDIVRPVAWDRIVPVKEVSVLREEGGCDLFIFGTLAQRSESNRRVLKELLDASDARERFFDVNLRLDYFSAEIIRDSLAFTTILKLNDEEVPVVSRLLWNEALDEELFRKRIMEEFPVRRICVTRGKEGSSLFDGMQRYDEPVVNVPVKDTVGAGDSFSAAFLTALLKGESPGDALRFASRLSSFVAGSDGAVPEYSGWILEDVERIRRL
jgi:fructokinase